MLDSLLKRTCLLIELSGYDDPEKAASEAVTEAGYEDTFASSLVKQILSNTDAIKASKKKLKKSRDVFERMEKQFG